MSGYTPLFDSIATGTLYGRWPDIGLWPIVLALSDRHGVIDVTPHYLAGVTGLPVADVVACMKRFCEHDPYSRTKAEDGSRLKLIDDHRDWGWIVVNHAKYREKARKQQQQIESTESGRDAARKRIERERVQPCPAVSSANRLSDSDSDSDSDSEKYVRRAREPEPEAQEVPRGTDEAHLSVLAIKAKYPKAAREDWLTAEKRMRQIVADGGTWREIEEGVERYQRHCRATHRMVQNPANFFSAVDRPWLQQWAIPPNKAETVRDSNIEISQGWINAS